MNEQEDALELDFSHLWEVIKKHFHIILGIVVVVTVATFLYSSLIIKPSYVSTLKFYIQSEGEEVDLRTEIDALNLSQRSTQTYVEILKTTDFLNSVSESLTVKKISAQALRERVQITPVANAGIINVTVTSDSAGSAYDIASVIAMRAPEESNRIKSNSTLILIESPLMPASPSAPNIPKNTLFGLIGSTAFAVVLVIAKELMSTKIRTKRDLEDRLDANVIAVVPRMK